MIVRRYFDNGYCGCDQEEMEYYANDMSHADIDADTDEWGRNEAESYAHVHFGWDEEYTEEDMDEYIEGCNWGWEEVTWEQYVEYCENWSLEPNEDWRD